MSNEASTLTLLFEKLREFVLKGVLVTLKDFQIISWQEFYTELTVLFSRAGDTDFLKILDFA